MNKNTWLPGEIYRNRRLVFSLAKNDFKTKYAGSYFGTVWAFIQPIVTICVYWFVFGLALRNGSDKGVPFVLWLIAGLIPWFFFQEGLTGGTNALLEYNYLVKKVVFNIRILPVVKVFSAVFVHCFFVVIVLVIYTCMGYPPSLYALQLVYYSFCIFMLILAVTYMTSAAVVFFRDLSQIINIALQVGVWVTPIMWDFNDLGLGGILQKILKLNPLFYIVQGYRDSLINKVAIWDHPVLTLYFWYSRWQYLSSEPDCSKNFRYTLQMYCNMESRMSEFAIQVKHLDKMYKLYNKPSDRLKEALGFKVPVREHYALRDVSFEVRRGETVGIIGTNGSGKSTILKIITGVLNPTGGEVTVDGRISALLELGAGFNMEYTGIENVYLNGTMMGFSKEEIDSRLQDILDFADIGDFVHQPVKAYSSGMFVRLAFAVAINIDPEILIVDEALSVGDVFFQAKCYRKFEEFKKMGRTILFVSHDLSSIARYCDRVVLLNKGVKLEEGSPKQMVDMYKQLLVGQDPTKQQVQEEKPKESWSEEFQVNPNMLEYGSKLAEITDFAVIDDKGRSTNTIEKGSSFQIRMKAVFHEAIQEPIMAYTFKDIKGTEITGTNTMFEKMHIEHSDEGDTCTVTFTQKMFLQGGEYLLAFGCTGYKDGEFTVFHRLYDACNITVVSEQNTVGFMTWIHR